MQSDIANVILATGVEAMHLMLNISDFVNRHDFTYTTQIGENMPTKQLRRQLLLVLNYIIYKRNRSII